MTVVVDASIAAAWLLPDEGDEAADRVLDRLEASHGFAPSIFRHEVRDVLLLSERRKRSSGDRVDASLLRLAKLPLRDRGPGDDVSVVRLARSRHPTSYDAACLALAFSSGTPLATLDRRPADAARACGVPLLGPLAP